MQPGATVGLNQSSTYPTTEQTLSSLSTLVNVGGLGQIGDVIHNFNAALSGRQPAVRELLTRLDNFVGLLDRQHDNIIALIQQLDRVAGRLAGQRDVIERALHNIPKALQVLIVERPRLTAALQKLGQFSDTATGLVADAKADLVNNLKNLEPTMRALADVGPDINLAVNYASVFPYGANNIDRIVRGDYINLFATFDITYPRIKRTLLLGTRWGDPYAKLIPAPGEPWYLNYSYNPLSVGVAPPPAAPTSPNTAQPSPPQPSPASGAPPPNPLPAPQGGS
jgi:ABC-type transporter Mla subunit MlaD